MNSPRLSTENDTKSKDRSQPIDGAVNQFLLLRAAAFDRRTSKGDVAVLAEIIQRHMKKHSNARASYTHLANMTGLSRRAAINSARRLVDLGYVQVGRLGSGTRHTEYIPNWKFAASGEPDFTSTSGEPQFTTVVNPTSPLEPLEVNSTSPHNPTDVTGRQAEGQESRNIDTPDPLADGLAATAAGSRDPEESKEPEAFDRFWRAYPRKYQKPKARAAWEKLAPDAELAETIIAAAGEWAAHYAEQGTEKKWIPAPANWLAGERYDEDLPAVYEDPKEAAIAKAKDKPAAKPKPAADIGIAEAEEPLFEWVGDVSGFVPVGKHIIEIKAADFTIDDDGNAEVVLLYDVDGKELRYTDVDHRFFIEHKDEKLQTRGQYHLNKLTAAAGITGIEDTEELIGAQVTAIVGRDGSVRYEPLAANDDESPVAEAA